MKQAYLILMTLFLSRCPSQENSSRTAASDSASAQRAGDRGKVTIAQDPDVADSLRLIVEIDDGSRTIGTIRRTSVEIATPYAQFNVPLALIKSVELDRSHGSATLRMANGDVLRGVLRLERLELTTKLGTIAIPLGIVRSISVRMKEMNTEVGLLAYYPFNGSARDASGNGNNGIVHGATLTEDRFGRSRSAYLLDGTVEPVKIPYSANLEFQSQMTLCGWVHPNGFYQGHCPANDIVNRGKWGSDRGSFFLRYAVGCDEPFSVEKERFSFGINLKGNPASEGVTGTTVVRAGRWYFVAGTYDGEAFKLYVDGVLEGTVPGSGTIGSMKEDLLLGGTANPAFPYRVDGILDDIRIYNRALSEDDIQELYRSR